MTKEHEEDVLQELERNLSIETEKVYVGVVREEIGHD